MSIAVVALMALLIIPVAAWANRPYEKYRRAYEEKYKVSLNPAIDEFQRDVTSGRRPNMLEVGPRTLLAGSGAGRRRGLIRTSSRSAVPQ
jgi:hypothetical protein